MRRVALIAGVVLATSACYHAVIETGRPAGPMIVTNNWAHSFIGGLVPPAVVNTAQRCPTGVSKVETQHSVANMLVQFLTWSIYSPMTITVTCAQGEENSPVPAVQASADHARAAIEQAVVTAFVQGKPVFVHLR